MAANWKRGRGVTEGEELIYRCGFLEKAAIIQVLQHRTALRGNKGWELMNTVCIEGDPDDRKSFIRTHAKPQRHDIMQNDAFTQKGCIVNPLLFIQQCAILQRVCLVCNWATECEDTHLDTVGIMKFVARNIYYTQDLILQTKWG